jgi:hypothetical protein
LILVIALSTTPTSAVPPDYRPNQIETATFAAQCDAFAIHVVGSGVDKPNPIVGYNITLKPTSGETLIITDSFPVTPNADGVFSKTFTNSWKTFGYKLEGKYRMSGSAVLVTALTPLSTVTIKFSPMSLSCKKTREGNQAP